MTKEQDMLVRLAGTDDADHVVRLVSALLVELGADALPAAARTAYEALVDGSAGFALLGGPPETPHAVCTVSYVHALRTLGRYGVIQEMYVAPELRSSGVGRELLGAALSRAADNGCAIVELGTPLHGERQIQFYLRAGFAVVGERLRWRPPLQAAP